MTAANRMPVVGSHAKPRQRMIEIKSTVRIRRGEGERREPHVLEEDMAAQLSDRQTLTNPSANFSKKTALHENFLSTPRTRTAVNLRGPLRCLSSPLLSLLSSFITWVFPCKAEGVILFYFLIRKTPLVSRAVTSSCASSLCVDKAAAKATGNKIRSEAAHEYLKRIVEQRRETEGGGRRTAEGWENKSRPQYNCMWLKDTKG